MLKQKHKWTEGDKVDSFGNDVVENIKTALILRLLHSDFILHFMITSSLLLLNISYRFHKTLSNNSILYSKMCCINIHSFVALW